MPYEITFETLERALQEAYSIAYEPPPPQKIDDSDMNYPSHHREPNDTIMDDNFQNGRISIWLMALNNTNH